MAYDNAQMAQAWGDLLALTPEQVETLQGSLDQWALGGARLATWSRLATDVNLFNDAAVAMVHDWYGGEADGGPNGDGLYPLMNSEAEVFFLPSPARVQADMATLEPKGELPSVDDLPAAGEPGDLWVVAGDAWGWNSREAVWKNLGPFRGAQGPAGVISGATIAMLAPGVEPTVTLGGTPSDRSIAFGIPAARDGTDGDDGVTPNVSAEVTMIAAGQQAVVTRSGPDALPVFTFQLPRSANGTDGREVEMQPGVTHLQWRYVGEPTWVNLFARADFKGDTGDKGDAFAFDAKPADLAGRAAYDAEPEGFTVLVMDTGTVYARVGAAPGVWSDGFPFGQTQNAILEALSALSAAPGLLYQEDGYSFSKRSIGAGSDTDVLDRQAADGRYRRQGQALPMADVTGLGDALDEKASAAAVLASLGAKADKDDTYTRGEVDAAFEALPDPPALRAQATVAEVRAGKSATTDVSPAAAAGAMALTPVTDAATIILDLDTGPNFTLLTTAGVGVGRTIGLPTNGNPGQYYTVRVTADAAGRTLAWNTAFKWPGGTVQAVANTAGAITEVAFKMISAARFDVLGFVKDIR